jgi:hypothetical protein
MEVCAAIQRQTVDYALENGKGSSLPMIGGLGYTMWRRGDPRGRERDGP